MKNQLRCTRCGSIRFILVTDKDKTVAVCSECTEYPLETQPDNIKPIKMCKSGKGRGKVINLDRTKESDILEIIRLSREYDLINLKVKIGTLLTCFPTNVIRSKDMPSFNAKLNDVMDDIHIKIINAELKENIGHT